MTRKTAIFCGRDAGLGIRCSILLSYGRNGSFSRETRFSRQGLARGARNRTEPLGTFGHTVRHILRHTNEGPGSLAGTEAGPNRVGGGMADLDYIPDGYTAEEWAGMCQCAEALDWPVTPTTPLKWYKVPEGHIVYFVGGDEGPVKIGFTQQPIKERLKCIQNGSPVKLKVLAVRPDIRAREKVYHKRFKAHRLHGEWFTRHPDILAEIDRLTTPKAGALVGKLA